MNDEGRGASIEAEIVVGCDGARSVTAEALRHARASEIVLPVRWLTVIAHAPPLEMHTIYAAHPRGFAGHMRRGPDQTRYYLEVPNDEALAYWPSDRIREELAVRLGVQDRLDSVDFHEARLLDLRIRVMEPMQDGRVFLAGDAAHLITPAGGKGMNLAVQDAVELAHGAIERYGPKSDGARLAAYSQTRLRHVWKTQAFSYWFLNILLANSGSLISANAGSVAPFAAGLRDGWVAALRDDPLLGSWFAHAYAGADVEP